jgi:hypothetical protein
VVTLRNVNAFENEISAPHIEDTKQHQQVQEVGKSSKNEQPREVQKVNGNQMSILVLHDLEGWHCRYPE